MANRIVTLRAPGQEPATLKPGSSSGILLHLSDSVVQDITKAAKTPDALRFSAGPSPKLRIGGRTIDLTISAEDFRTELFISTANASSSSSSSTTDLTFTALLSHQGRAASSTNKSTDDTAGSDAALAALQSSLASYEQEKQANKVNIANTLLPVPKNRFDAARKERLESKKNQRAGNQHTSQAASPLPHSISTPKLAPTSLPPSDVDAKRQAAQFPLLHLLAMAPLTTEAVADKTHIPADELNTMLARFAKQSGGKWQLGDRAYRDLDVWKFAYSCESDRQAAIDNAIKAYDRLRLDTNEKLWQMLLPREERGKGKCLSKLQLGGGGGGGGKASQGLTPHHQSSPLLHAEAPGESSRVASAANSPRLGVSTPRPSSGAKGDVMKRLLSKNPQKARAVEEAKEKKRKEREAAADEREGGKASKRQAPATGSSITTTKGQRAFKSAEIVHPSDDEDSANEEPLVNERVKKAKVQSASQPAVKSSSSDSDTPLIAQKARDGRTNTAPPSKSAVTSSSLKPHTASHNTPPQRPHSNSLSAPNTHHKTQRSPHNNAYTRPTVPSPLGAARPRVASDVSDRGAVGVQRIRQGVYSPPKGLGISEGQRKRHDTGISLDSSPAHIRDVKRLGEHSSPEKESRPSNGHALADPDEMAAKKKKASQKAASAKRKAAEPPAEQAPPPAKQRKHEPEGKDSPIAKNPNGHAPHTPSATVDAPNGTDLVGGDELMNPTWEQGLNTGEKYQVSFPVYEKLYDELDEMVKRGERPSQEKVDLLWKMQATLERMKREMDRAHEAPDAPEGANAARLAEIEEKQKKKEQRVNGK
ncbi:hypothetical protein BDY17DRAFT_297069 [Neohortaea acidophila]|uniref:Uncharacterized protein n=1 Tax=Neohortaea acidophila TaxID=245834 RepID=A0A6A6PTL9_9PEZI|nr:uncharacterized protein BDY17DRAFT_297069 [Neohortaea acidophila]KAF2483235.1 hypothetical protein BDY17DRAFT_297069 [Neohortaea acidophila]